ncbi:hypothetical protein [Nocardia australiensis]|uniref:hypothetical protein n=1 Tax=Nocardia australiensis TaxID=2887191 RepID=UPI001D137B3A|nr:hypothetical protein [Nocardia australiensis]
MRFAILSAAVLAPLAASTTLLGAGSASAVAPVGQTDRIGVSLSHEETAAIAGGPLPALVTMFVPPSRIGAGLESGTEIHRDENGGVHASLRQIMTEAATHPDGSVTVFVNVPGTRGGRVLDIYQQWN